MYEIFNVSQQHLAMILKESCISDPENKGPFENYITISENYITTKNDLTATFTLLIIQKKLSL